MLQQQKIAMLIMCFLIFFFILELVRRRKLREEYSWLWLLISGAMFVLVVKYSWLVGITKIIGASLPTSTLFLGAFIFLMVLSVQFSVRISRLDNQIKNLIQENALLKCKIDEIGKDR